MPMFISEIICLLWVMLKSEIEIIGKLVLKVWTIPKSFTLAELKAMGTTTIATVLQCSGNGRGFFEHGPSGSQWETGAAACVFLDRYS